MVLKDLISVARCKTVLKCTGFIWILLLTSLTFHSTAVEKAYAKAAFKSKKEMVQSADFIALVDIVSVKPVKIKGKTWTYQQEARARPIKILKAVKKSDKAKKRTAKTSLRLLGDESFECAQVKFTKGSCLVFLKKEEGGFYTRNNWGLSCMPVEDGKIKWFDGSNNGFRREFQPKEVVFADIKRMLSRNTGVATSQTPTGLEKGKPTRSQTESQKATQTRSATRSQTNPKTIPKKKSEKSVPSYIEPLIKATRVTDIQIGEGGEYSKNYAIFARALKDREVRLPALTAQIESASPAGKIYLAMLIKHHFPEAAKPILEGLLKNKDGLEIQSGCEIMEYTVSSAAKELLERGKLIMFSY